MPELTILNIIGILLVALFAFAFVSVLIIEPIADTRKLTKRNQKYVEEHGLKGKPKKRCVDCKYCRTYLYHPFYKYGRYGNVMVSKIPSYCRKFRTSLSNEEALRCISRLAEQAEWERTGKEKS